MKQLIICCSPKAIAELLALSIVTISGYSNQSVSIVNITPTDFCLSLPDHAQLH